jgi:hypothetical protein
MLTLVGLTPAFVMGFRFASVVVGLRVGDQGSVGAVASAELQVFVSVRRVMLNEKVGQVCVQ